MSALLVILVRIKLTEIVKIITLMCSFTHIYSSYKIRKQRIFACGIDLHVIIKAFLMYFSRDGG